MSITQAYRRDANYEAITNPGLIAEKSIVYAAAGTGATGASTLFTVTGDVVVRVFAKCTEDLDSDGSATLEVGIVGNTPGLIAQTAYSGIDTGEIWLDTSSASVENLPAEKILVGGTDIIQTIATEAVKDGELTYYCLWYPLSDDGSVVAA